MKDGFQWDAANLRHIARHNVTAGEAEQVLTSAEHVYAEDTPDTVNDEERWKVYGMTSAGRLLTVVFVAITDTYLRVVTAYEMDTTERQEFFDRSE